MELVTGGAGFIGSHLVDSLVAKGKRVRVLDNFSSGREEFLSHHAGSGRVEVMRGDLLDLESVRSAMKEWARSTTWQQILTSDWAPL